MNGKPLKKPIKKAVRHHTKENQRKRIASKRKKKLIFRRFSLVFAFLSVIFGILFGVYFLLSKVFAVKNIAIQGSVNYSDSEVIEAGKLKTGDSLLFLNSKKIENNIYKSLANIDDVKISKKFPNKLIISLEDAIPTYYLKVENEYIVASAKNKFLTKSSQPPENIVGVIGLEVDVGKNGRLIYKNAEIGHLCEEILTSFKDKNIVNINEIDISDLQNITLTYDNRIKINIGNNVDVDYKILTLKEIINNKISKTEKGVLNLKDLKTENRTYFTYE